MKINFIGNVCNNAYVITKFLRKKGVDARLFVLKPYHRQYLPESEDPELLNSYPEWIETIDASHFCCEHPFLRHPFYERSLLKRLEDCDIIHSFDWGHAYAQFCRRPFIFHVSGADLNYYPFVRFKPDLRAGNLSNLMQSLKMGKGRREAFGRCVMGLHSGWLGLLMRRAIKMSAMVCTGTSVSSHYSIQKLGIRNVAYLPLIMDCEKFRRRADNGKNLSLTGKKEFTVFSSTRHVWGQSGYRGAKNNFSTGDMKANDRAINAFARFVREKDEKARLFMVETGRHVWKSKGLIEALGAESNVTWLPHMPRHELVDWYSWADVVFDQFLIGGMGTAALEAIACEVPLITYLYKDGYYFNRVYGEVPPVLNCHTEEDIYHALCWCYDNRVAARQLGEQTRHWVWRHHHWENLIGKYIDLYQQIRCE